MTDMRDWLESNTPLWFRGRASHVRIEDYLEDDTYVLRAELAGIDPTRDVNVTLEADMLTIQGERREVTKDKYRREFYYGSFSRTIALPSGIKPEDITASYADGVLEVRVPLRSDEAATRRGFPSPPEPVMGSVA